MRRVLLLLALFAITLPASARIIRVDAFDCSGLNMQPGTNECWDRPSFQDESNNAADWGTALNRLGDYRKLPVMKPVDRASIVDDYVPFVGGAHETNFNAIGAGRFAQMQYCCVDFGASIFAAFDLRLFFQDIGRGYDPTTLHQPSRVRDVLKPEWGDTSIQVAWGRRNTDLSDTSETRYLDPTDQNNVDPQDLPLFRVTWYFENMRQVLIDMAGYTAAEADALLRDTFELEDGPLLRDSFGRVVPTVQLITGLDANGNEILELTGLKTTKYSYSDNWNGATQTCFEFYLGSAGQPNDSCAQVVTPNPTVPEPSALLLTALALGVMARVVSRSGRR